MSSTLTWHTFVTPSIPTAITDLPPGISQRVWSPITAVLIAGERDAVLVDPFMTVSQASELADWVATFDKNLTTIYVTHAHGDHWFGLSTLLERFPGARAVAAPNVVASMRQGMDPDFVDSFWRTRFPGQIPDNLVAAEPLEGTTLDLEGHALRVIDLAHTDTDDTTALHVPDLDLVVAGDAVYNGVHLYLAESPGDVRKSWLSALDTIEALGASIVIAGHKNPDLPDDPKIIEETRAYIHQFAALEGTTSTTEELYAAMLADHGDRLNQGALWGSSRASKGF
ncbi:MAG: hypothetical protein QOH68_1096 [Nocardioidaceae bacterium]|nr:hypothetical protein [Nocardioidaceae bacterium]